MIRQWMQDRRRRIAESHAKAKETQRLCDRVARQWPEVNEATDFSREQRRINHLTELFLSLNHGRD